MHLLYLHGFASSARSSKAAYFRARAADRGVELLTPDFNEPDFEGLTITRMVDQVSTLMARLAPGPVSIIGSSLGAFIAVQVALRQPRVDRLVLLAPALDFSGNRLRDLGDRGKTPIPDVPHPGDAFRKAYFGLQPGSVEVAPNQPKTNYYVLTLDRRDPATFASLYAPNGDEFRYKGMARDEAAKESDEQWISWLRQQAGLKPDWTPPEEAKKDETDRK